MINKFQIGINLIRMSSRVIIYKNFKNWSMGTCFFMTKNKAPKMALERSKTISRYYFRCFEVLQTHMHILRVKEGGESEYRRIF